MTKLSLKSLDAIVTLPEFDLNRGLHVKLEET